MGGDIVEKSLLEDQTPAPGGWESHYIARLRSVGHRHVSRVMDEPTAGSSMRDAAVGHWESVF